MLKKLMRLNWDDYVWAAAVPTGVFLITQIVTAVVMALVKPGWPDFEGLSISGILLPGICAFMAVLFAFGHVGISFDMAVKFGCTRRRALAQLVGVLLTQSTLGWGLSALYILMEQRLLPYVWAAVRGVPGPLTTEVIAIPLWVLPLLFVGSITGGILFGALVQRFGRKGSWVLFGAYMAVLIVPQMLPSGFFDRSPAMLFPVLGVTAFVMLLCGFVWAVWSLLHTSVRA